MFAIEITEHQPDMFYRIVNDGLMTSDELVISQYPNCGHEQTYSYTVQEDGLTIDSSGFIIADPSSNTFQIQTTSTDHIGSYSLTMSVSIDDGTGSQIIDTAVI